MRLVVFIVALLSTCVVQGNAQIVSPGLDKGEFEIGFARKLYRSDFEGIVDQYLHWARPSIFMKYGATTWFTLTGEIYVFQGDPTDQSPDQEYLHLTTGFGGIAKLYEWGKYRLVVTLHYNRDFHFDTRLTGYHKDDQLFMVASSVCGEGSIIGQRIDIWVGPVFEKHVLHDYEARPDCRFPPLDGECGCPCVGVRKSKENLSLLVGIESLFLRHIRPNVHVLLARYVQPRIAIGYMF